MRKIVLIATVFVTACSFNPSGVIADDTAVDAGVLADGAAAPDGCDAVTPDATAPDAAQDAGAPDASPPDAAPPVPTIACLVGETGIVYRIYGGILDHLWSPSGTGAVASPTYLEYGDGYDGWVLPYPGGSTKQKVAFTTDGATYEFVLSASVDDLNFFLTDPSDTDASDGAVGGKYFDLTEWTFVNVTNADGVTPDCRLDSAGGGILH